ncbi:MAG: ATP synthase F1 subunit gamma [Muribaculum sp.]|nr:ATP synthase F1 subunit gamma [Muribaculaceae bacterium]MCM1080477.1 ATP synthase F1 subunit gamma [Muribaculum sp.]
MATLRELKGRITSVNSTEKITSAMKMISSAKMHKAEQSLRKLLPFRAQIQTIMGNLLSTDGEFSSPLIEERLVEKVAIVVLGSDDGLCGAYNINVFKGLLLAINQLRQKYGEGIEIHLYPVGQKMLKAVRKLAAGKIILACDKLISAKSTPAQVKELTTTLTEAFTNGQFDKLDVLYMSYKSVSRQVLTREPLLPVSPRTLVDNEVKQLCRPCIFEPDANTIFTSVLPLFVRAFMQETFTQNAASEQAARVMAMQTAADNARKLLDDLQLEYNKLRQQAITSELLDILGGQVR